MREGDDHGRVLAGQKCQGRAKQIATIHTYRRMSRKWTLEPDVTLSVPPPCASSIEDTGSPRSSEVVCVRVRRSHQLDCVSYRIEWLIKGSLTGPARPLLRSRRWSRPAPRPRQGYGLSHRMRRHRDYALGRGVPHQVGPSRRGGSSSRVRPAKSDQLSYEVGLLPVREEIPVQEHLTVKRYWGCDCGFSATDRTMCLCWKVWSASPELVSQIFLRDRKSAGERSPTTGNRSTVTVETHAVKSALPVMAREVSREILDDQTAPL